MDNKSRVAIFYAFFPSDVERKVNEFLSNLADKFQVDSISFKEPRYSGSHYVAYIVYSEKVVYSYNFNDVSITYDGGITNV